MIDIFEFSERPKELCVEITTECNARCDFCYNQNTFADQTRKHNCMTTESVKQMIDRISKVGINRIRFTGGEPLVRKDIYEIAEHAKSRGLTTVLNTNGMLIDEKNADKVTELFDICLISFFSSNEKYVDKVIGIDGAYKKKLNALGLIRNCKQIWCSTVIGDPNLPDDLENLHNIMSKYNVFNWFLLRANPIKKNKMPNTHSDIERIVDAILLLKEKEGRLVNIGNPIPFCCYKPFELAQIVDDGVLYSEGRSKMVVNPFGKIVVDYCIDTVIGDILKDDILSVWNSSQLNDIRGDKYLPEICSGCKLLKGCWGGSRFASKIVNERYGELDPLARPFLYKDVLFDE